MSSTSAPPNFRANWTETFDDEQTLSRGQSTSLALTLAILAVVIIFGTAGNILVCLVIGVYSPMRTVFNILVLSLSVSDLFVCVLVAPMYAARIAYEFATVAASPGTSPQALAVTVSPVINRTCRLSAFMDYICTSQSLLTIVQMGVIRVIAVAKSSKSKRFHISKLVPCVLIAANYIIAVTFSIFTYDSGTFTFCLDDTKRGNLSTRLSSLALLFGELALVFVCYVWIYYKTKKQRLDNMAVNPRASTNKPPINRFDIAIAKTVLLIVTAFGVSFIPYMVFIALWVAGLVDDAPHTMSIFPAIIALSSVANPIIYAFNSTIFRRQLLKLLRLDKVVRRRTVPAVANLNLQALPAP